MTKRAKSRLQWGAWGAFSSVLVIAIAVLSMHTVPAAEAQVSATRGGKVQTTATASTAYVDVTKVPIIITPQSQPVIIAPVKPDDPKGAAAVVKSAMHTSNWRLVVIAGLLLVVLSLRKLAGFLPAKAAAWVQSDRGGATLARLAGVLTVLVNGMVAGGKFDPQLLVDGVLAAATAAGSFNLAKRLAAPSDKVPPSPAQ